MCRLYGFLANEPAKVDCSLVYAQNALMQQSRVDESGLDHTDGWGIVTYHEGVPHLNDPCHVVLPGLLDLIRDRAGRLATNVVAHGVACPLGE